MLSFAMVIMPKETNNYCNEQGKKRKKGGKKSPNQNS